MEHSPDGNAYLVCHGARAGDPDPRFASLSWGTANQIYLTRVTPTPENINDASKYEFFAGHDAAGKPKWTGDLKEIEPLIDWNNNCGCVTTTYNPYLRKYLMCVTDAWPTTTNMRTYILEADEITGPWRLVSYMKDFGQQAYFVNIPSKFIHPGGRKLWLCYSANFFEMVDHKKIPVNPPGGRYGLVLQEMELI